MPPAESLPACTFGSLFAGIGGFDLALERAGMVCRWQVELNPDCKRVLAAHWPGVERFDDVREGGAHNLEPVAIITFGSPCQDLSVAGHRRGLAGDRSGLYFEAVRIIRELRPEFAVWENVPGALTSNAGRDFGAVLDALAEAGAMDIAWRILDAQFFGVAQRRRRLFLVADFRGQRSAQILFESPSGGGDSASRHKAGQEATYLFTRRAGASFSSAGDDVAGTLLAHSGNTRADQAWTNQLIAHTLVRHLEKGGDPSMDTYIVDTPQITSPHNVSNPRVGDACHPLAAGAHPPLLAQPSVRRLTPTECERLQGFPDGWTAGASDSARYRMLGNAVAVPVVEWIARRIVSTPPLVASLGEPS